MANDNSGSSRVVGIPAKGNDPLGLKLERLGKKLQASFNMGSSQNEGPILVPLTY